MLLALCAYKSKSRKRFATVEYDDQEAGPVVNGRVHLMDGPKMKTERRRKNQYKKGLDMYNIPMMRLYNIIQHNNVNIYPLV